MYGQRAAWAICRAGAARVMADKSWKALERRVCARLGGTRRGPTGRDLSDCTDAVPFAVEVKRSAQGAILTRWLEQAKRHGKVERKPWILVVAGHNDRAPTATVDFEMLAQALSLEGRNRKLEVVAAAALWVAKGDLGLSGRRDIERLRDSLATLEEAE